MLRCVRRLRRALLVAGVVGMGLVPAAAQAATFHVSPTGSGLACTDVAPCNAQVLLDATSGSPPFLEPAPGDVIDFAAGEYDFRGRFFQLAAAGLVLQGPDTTGNAATHVAYLDFGAPGPGPFADMYAVRIFANDVTLRRLTIVGARPGNLVGANVALTGTTLDRVVLRNESNSAATAFSGDDLVATNSIFRYEGTNTSGRALDATGTVTGSLMYAPYGAAVGVTSQNHDAAHCTLALRNSLAWGAASNLRLDETSAGCPTLSASYEYSWIPDVAGTPSWGGGHTVTGASIISPGTGNLPNDAAVFNPLDPASTYLGDYVLAADSPAVDAGCTTGCGTRDYYGQPRPIGAANDIGPTETTLAPTPSSVAVSDVAAASVRVVGTVNPNNAVTDYVWELRAGVFDAWRAVASSTLAASTVRQAVGARVENLQPGTEYQVRLRATNAVGSNLSASVTTFRTLRASSDTNDEGGADTAVAPRVSLRGLRAKVSRRNIILTAQVTVSGRGTLTQRATTGRAPKVLRCRSYGPVVAAGTYTVRCQLGAKGRQALRRASLRLTVRTVFSVPDGRTASVVRSLTVRRAR